MGNLEKIWLKRAKLGVMDEVLKAEMEAGVGLVKNLEKNIFRQITLIEKSLGSSNWNLRKICRHKLEEQI